MGRLWFTVGKFESREPTKNPDWVRLAFTVPERYTPRGSSNSLLIGFDVVCKNLSIVVSNEQFMQQYRGLKSGLYYLLEIELIIDPSNPRYPDRYVLHKFTTLGDQPPHDFGDAVRPEIEELVG